MVMVLVVMVLHGHSFGCHGAAWSWCWLSWCCMVMVLVVMVLHGRVSGCHGAADRDDG